MNPDDISSASQYLTFNLGDDEFALEISKVREVVDYAPVTKVPRMPEYLCGVINLRGNVVSVVDLRLKLGMGRIRKTEDTCIVIVDVLMEGDVLQVGILADSVQEVIDLDTEQIQPPPGIGTKLDTQFVRGMGKRKENDFAIILDIDRVLADNRTAVALLPGEHLPEEAFDVP